MATEQPGTPGGSNDKPALFFRDAADLRARLERAATAGREADRAP